MIRQLIIATLSLFAIVFLVIGSVSAASSFQAKPVPNKNSHQPGPPLNVWNIDASFQGGGFMCQLCVRLNHGGSYTRHYVRKMPHFLLGWDDVYSGPGGIRYYSLMMSPTVAFLLAAIFGSYPAVVFFVPCLRRRVRRRRGLCMECGYNLAGNITGICPECGTKFDSKTGPAELPQPGEPS